MYLSPYQVLVVLVFILALIVAETLRAFSNGKFKFGNIWMITMLFVLWFCFFIKALLGIN